MSFALLVIGANGANGRMLRQTLSDFAANPELERYGVTALPIFRQEQLVRAEEVSVAGWDVRGTDLPSGLKPGRVTQGLRSAARDTLAGDEDGGRAWSSVFEGAALIADEIKAYAGETGAEHTLVLNLASPVRRVELNDSQGSEDEFLQASSSDVSSAYPYLFGALEAGAHFIDFTPSPTLEIPGLHGLAMRSNTQLAGRDGSTGQTYLKLTIAGALATRGMRIENWYSTNVLGNRDGMVLEIPGVDLTKMHDKMVGLNAIGNMTAGDHRVDIRYMPALGDVKEAWDSVVFRDIFGNEGELQVRWKARDTPLAVQSLLDLVRIFLSSVGHHEPGIRSDLAFFFKHPIGSRSRTPEFLFAELLSLNPQLLVAGEGRADLAW